jgi:hypothetical protein
MNFIFRAHETRKKIYNSVRLYVYVVHTGTHCSTCCWRLQDGDRCHRTSNVQVDPTNPCTNITNDNGDCNGDTETATMTSEASIPEPPNVFIYNEDTKDDIPNNVTHVKVDPSVKEIHAWAFLDCLSLVEVEFSERLELIGHGAFANCSSLTTVKVPSSVIEIQDSAFADCTSLASLDLPEGLQSIGARSFSLCESLATLHIPSTVCKMGNHAVFGRCAGLRSITLPDTLEIIGDEMFYKCISLTHIEIPPKVTKIGKRAFKYCVGLKDLLIPSSVVEIGASAFACCRQLMSVHLLGNLRTIEEETFYKCSSLTHVRIPSSVTRIEHAAFANCTRLVSWELPEGLETMHVDVEYDSDDNEEASNISDCLSLVNLVVPSEQRFQQVDVFYDDQFMEVLKLRHVASSFTDLVSKLQHRFDDLPVHRLCYYQSYYPLMEAMENLRQSMDADPAAGNKVDAFGMTPFHILALSQTPNLSLFQALVKIYKVDMIHTRDKSGSTPIDYLCKNHIPASALVIRSLLTTIFAERVRWLGLVRWKSDMVAAMDKALAVEWASRRREIRLLYFKLATYERLESVSLLEMALWQVKIDSCKALYETDHERDGESSSKRPRLDKSHLDGVDRQSCRINSRADVVISNVLPFLDKVCREDYITSEPSF